MPKVIQTRRHSHRSSSAANVLGKESINRRKAGVFLQTSVCTNSQRLLLPNLHFTAAATGSSERGGDLSKITQRVAEWGLDSNLGHGPFPQAPQTRARRIAPLTAAPESLQAGTPRPGSSRGPDPPEVPRDSSGHRAYAPTTLAASVPDLEEPAGPPQPQTAHLRTRAALVAPPRSPAPFPPTRLGPLWPGLLLISVSAPLPHPGPAPGAGRRLRPLTPATSCVSRSVARNQPTLENPFRHYD